MEQLKGFADYYNALDPSQPPPEKSYDLSNDIYQEPSSAPKQDSSAPAPATEGQPSPASAISAPKPVAVSAYSAPTSSSDLYNQLFSGVNKSLTQSTGALGGAVEKFNTAAGPGRTFESIGGAATISGALKPGSDLAEARSLVNAKYAGPQQLDQDTLDSLLGSLTELRPLGAALGSAAGAQELLRRRNPGLTSGQLQMESQRLLKDQGYRNLASQYQSQINSLFSDTQRAQSEAQALAQARTDQEAEISRLAREQLTGEQSALGKELDTRFASAAEKERASQLAYDKFTKSGSLEDLQALSAITGEDYSGFNTEGRQKSAAAQQAWADVMTNPEFASLADVPLAELGFTRHGREALYLPKEYVKELQKQGKTKREIKDIQALARKRNIALEQAGFSSGTATRGLSDAEKLAETPEQRKLREEGGEFAAYSPLYYRNELQGLEGGAENFTPADLRAYIQYQQGTSPTKASLSSADERSRYNALQDLLGGSDRLDEPLVANLPSEILADLDTYKADEARILGGRQEALESAEQSFEKKQAKKRARYKAENTTGGRLMSKMPGGRNLHSIMARLGQPGLKIAPGAVSRNF